MEYKFNLMKISNEHKKIIAKLTKSINKLNKAKNSTEFCEVLKEHYKTGYGFGGTIPGSKEILKKIKTTKDKNIQMCLALYSGDKDLTENLYFKTKDEKIRIACLEKENTAPLWQDYDGVNDKGFFRFLKTSSDRELYAYYTNKRFKLTYVEFILDKIKPYDKISEKLYRNIVLILENNPNTQIDPDNLIENYRIPTAEEYDGWGQYEDQKTFKAYKKELSLVKKLRNLE